MEPIQIGRETITQDSFLLIAGPCVLESKALGLQVAEFILNATHNLPVTFVFKASYEKANRTSASSFRGPGLEEGLKCLEEIKQELGVMLLSDIHEPEQAGPASQVLDILQIPAFLSRQTRLLTEAARTGKAVNVKKGQFMAPHDMEHVIEKVKSINPNIMVTERGASFGYNNLVVDMRSLEIMRKFNCPVIYDATHSVQLPGGGQQSGGNREFVPVLARAAAGAGINGLFVETHPNPDKALSDSATMISLDQFPRLIKEVLAIHAVRKELEQ